MQCDENLKPIYNSILEQTGYAGLHCKSVISNASIYKFDLMIYYWLLLQQEICERKFVFNDLQEFYVDMQFTYVNLEGLWYHNQVYGTLRRKVLARIVYMSSTERDFGMCIGFQKFDVQFWSLYFLLVSLFWLTNNMHYLHVSFKSAFYFVISY